MRINPVTILVLITALAPLSCFAEGTASSWALPASLSERNTSIKYRYTAFGRTNSGSAAGQTGRVWLASNDPRSVRASITIPSPDLFSDDSTPALNGILSAQLPPVVFDLDAISGICNPPAITANHPCAATAIGSIHMGSFSRAVKIPIRIVRQDQSFLIAGESDFDAAAARGRSDAIGLIQSGSVSFVIKIPATTAS